MKYLILLVGFTSSAVSAEVLRGSDAAILLGQSTILDSSIESEPISSNTLTDDDFLLLGMRKVLSLVQHDSSIYLCEHRWENITGGNGGSEPYWRQTSVVCSN